MLLVGGVALYSGPLSLGVSAAFRSSRSRQTSDTKSAMESGALGPFAGELSASTPKAWRSRPTKVFKAVDKFTNVLDRDGNSIARIIIDRRPARLSSLVSSSIASSISS